jgi:DNA-binding response OmpR family regulator
VLHEADARKLKGLTILLVEDEALIAMELEMVLEAFGAIVRGPVPDLDAALAAARDERFDAAVLDIDLGGEDVFPVAEVLQSRHVPFLFHTGHGLRHELAQDYPEVPVCAKPMPGERLARHVAALL